VSAFTQIEAQIAPRIALTAGLRHDDYTYAGSATTPRLALVATPDAGSVVKLLWGRAYRAPNIYEQFVTTTSNARPALSAETIETWELTAERRLFRNLHAQGSLYRYQVDDLIDLLYDPVDYSSWYQNQSRSRAAGGELGLLFRGGFVRANLSYGFSAAVNDETGERMNNSPRHLIKGLATVQIPAGFEATWAQRFESGRLTIQGLGSERFTHGTLTLRKPGLFKRGEAVLQIRNVFDASYATPGGFEHRLNTIPQDGRTFTLRLEWGF
jgi:iron complex outermembrane receptor protein